MHGRRSTDIHIIVVDICVYMLTLLICMGDVYIEIGMYVEIERLYCVTTRGRSL
jgi:hypothetical protein